MTEGGLKSKSGTGTTGRGGRTHGGRSVLISVGYSCTMKRSAGDIEIR